MDETIEINKRPWEAQAGDVLVRNPEHPEQHVTWTVTGNPYTDGWYTILTYSMPEGGEGRAVCKPGQYVTLRGPATYVVEALYSDVDRDDALRVMSCGDRFYIAGRLRADYPEMFDQLLKRLVGPLSITPTTEKRPA